MQTWHGCVLFFFMYSGILQCSKCDYLCCIRAGTFLLALWQFLSSSTVSVHKECNISKNRPKVTNIKTELQVSLRLVRTCSDFLRIKS